MKLYEIDASMAALVDEETGEISDFEAFLALQMERDTKIENTALWHKNLAAEAEAIKAEEQNLSKRRRILENQAERLKGHLGYMLEGNAFKTAKVACSFRKTSAVELSDGFMDWAKVGGAEYLRTKDPEPDKKAIADALKQGIEIHGAELIQRNSLTIK